MKWYWVVLALWYASLVPVVIWNLRQRDSWERLDAYPLPLRVRLLLPFTKSWRSALRPADRDWIHRFRRSFLLRCYGVVILPPLLIFGWLFSSTWARYTHAVERRERLESRIERIEEERGSLENSERYAWPQTREPRAPSRP